MDCSRCGLAIEYGFGERAYYRGYDKKKPLCLDCWLELRKRANKDTANPQELNAILGDDYDNVMFRIYKAPHIEQCPKHGVQDRIFFLNRGEAGKYRIFCFDCLTELLVRNCTEFAIFKDTTKE